MNIFSSVEASTPMLREIKLNCIIYGSKGDVNTTIRLVATTNDGSWQLLATSKSSEEVGPPPTLVEAPFRDCNHKSSGENGGGFLYHRTITGLSDAEVASYSSSMEEEASIFVTGFTNRRGEEVGGHVYVAGGALLVENLVDRQTDAKSERLTEEDAEFQMGASESLLEKERVDLVRVD
ncbi:hypothetical protein Q3G72_004778 [Acer saccharum]|nr:hypothetical protein Q3G72_004778 [Acer saccharum]